MKLRHLAPDGETSPGGPGQRPSRTDDNVPPDLNDDETAYEERGEIRRGLLDEDDRTEGPLTLDTHTGDDETVTPGA